MRIKPVMMYSFVGLIGVLGVVFYPRPLNTLEAHTPAILPIGDAVYRLQKTTTAKPQPYTFCVLHENERTGVACILQFMREIGGQVWELKSAGDRNVSFHIKKKKFSFDPNRIFTQQGVANTMLMLSRATPTAEAQGIVNSFAQRITDSLFSQAPNITGNIIVSVHNNTDGAYSALSHLPDSTNALGVRDIYINDTRDPDNFFYVTRRFDFNHFKTLGYNVILQDNKYIRDDGSLSVYCGKRRIRYINIEAQHYQRDEQMQMLYAVHDLLKKVESMPIAMLKPMGKKSDSLTEKANAVAEKDKNAMITVEKPIVKDSVKQIVKPIAKPATSAMLPDEIEEDVP